MAPEGWIASSSIYRLTGDDRWTLEIRLCDGRRSRSRWDTKKAAQAELRRLQGLDEAGVHPDGPLTPFADVACAWQRWYADYAGVAPATLIRHRGAINVWILPGHDDWGFTRHRIGSVDRDAINELKKTMRDRGMSEWTITKVYAVLQMIMDYAVDKGIIARSPFQGMHPRDRPRKQRARQPRVFELEEIWAVFDEIRRARGCAVPDYSLAWLTAYYQGMRVSEVLAIRTEDFDWRRKTLMRRSIKEQGTPGARPLLGPLGPMLHAYIHDNDIDGYLWPALGRSRRAYRHAERVMSLRMDGLNWEAIGREVGITGAGAKKTWHHVQEHGLAKPTPRWDTPTDHNYFRSAVWDPALTRLGLHGYVAKDLRNTCIVHLIDGDMLGEPWEPQLVAHHVDHDIQMTLGIYYRIRPERAHEKMGRFSHAPDELSVEDAIARYRTAGVPSSAQAVSLAG